MAFVQLNDPDALFWTLLYGSCAFLSLVLLLGIKNNILFFFNTAFCLVAIIISSSGFVEYIQQPEIESLLQKMTADKPYIEETREFLGAIIALILISIQQFFLSSKTNAVSKQD